jgi:plasmid stabilization system protein ParE
VTGVRFVPAAEAELADAFDFYERAKVGIGVAFLGQVERTVERIHSFPRSGIPFGRSTRARPVANFPFWVVYRDENGAVIVLAVAHQRRMPGYWRRRAGSSS